MRGVGVDGVAARGVVVDGLELRAFGAGEAEGLDGAVERAVAPEELEAEAGARAAPMAIDDPRVAATPRLVQPTNRRLRAAGWGRGRRAMGRTVRREGETGVRTGPGPGKVVGHIPKQDYSETSAFR